MKAAILLSGQLRLALDQRVINFLFDFLKSNFYNYEIYMSMWDINGKQKEQLQKIYSPAKIENEIWRDWVNKNKESIENFQKKFDFKGDLQLRYSTGGIMSQWYKIYKAFSLIENPFDFDVIVRCRTDISFNNVNIKNLDFNNFWVEDLYLDDYGYRDYMFFSNPKNMGNVCNLFNNLPSLDLKSNTIHPHSSYHFVLAEHVLRVHSDNYCKADIIPELKTKKIR